jgi:hypothetical protein
MSSLVHPEVLPQLGELSLAPDRPLLVCDADEVLVRFIAALERFLERRGLYYDWRKYDFRSTIRRRDSDAVIAVEEVGAVRDAFFEQIEHLDPVPGAAEALQSLAARCQIVVLTNLPVRIRDARRRGLARLGMPYPVVTNQGGKGPTVRHLVERLQAPAVFLDDMPQNHASVAAAAGHVRRVQFIEDPRLERLMGRTEDAHHQADSWAKALPIIERELGF